MGVEVDRDRLGQVVDDLVSNAQKYRPRVLAVSGATFVECDPPQVAALRALAGRPIRVVPDLAGLDRVVVVGP